ncbi:AIR carboxylase family protein [Candidatus Gracilibacteria bacterium]|nr:AIR carboxylase family protein [Candidatus Gracilibacteria bacterium]MCF7855999.1 AIR carboxylase family protein [Candidatus Gracilibacteria bacterium]MCF7896308.1 AIR carboxylase family protein [Candidatus Gracilibacteria bacterium]
MKAILLLGSKVDKAHAAKITKELKKLKIPFDVVVASAHKNTRQVLALIEKNEGEKKLVYITIAGRSNALSGVVAANSTKPVIACPPFKDKNDYLVNIHSTLQMPSGTPVLTILDPGNCAVAAARILKN